MTSLDIGSAAVRSLRNAIERVVDLWRRVSRWLNSVLPKGLYARALLIIIAPMVILQSVVAFVFMERHWSLVTQRLSAGVVGDIAALIDISRGYPQGAGQASRCSTKRCRRKCASRSAGRSGSTPWASRRWSRSGCSSTRP